MWTYPLDKVKQIIDNAIYKELSILEVDKEKDIIYDLRAELYDGFGIDSFRPSDYYGDEL